MSKTIAIIIRFLQGDPQQGLPIYVDISLIDDAGLGQHLLGRCLQSLPISPVLEIQSHYQTLHQDWGQYSRWGDYPLRTSRGISIPEDQIHHYSGGEEQKKRELCRQANLDRIQQLDRWLDNCLRPILPDILAKVFAQPKDTPVRLVVETGDIKLQNLPWEKCSILIENLSKGDHYVSTMISPETIAHTHHWHDPLNVLLIRGADENIDTNVDLEKIKKNLPDGASLRPLSKPTWHELRTDLTNYPQDIVIFAGHSMTNPDGQDGSIFISDTESLSIEDLSDTFTKAVKQGGLKLIFLNSCEGMGLARRLTMSPELKHKNLPYIIVMRQKVHDQIAHDFLDQFLQFFFVRKYSLERSVSEARKSIEIHESFSPGASSLPVLWGGTRVSPLSLMPSFQISLPPSLTGKLKDLFVSITALLKSHPIASRILFTILILTLGLVSAKVLSRLLDPQPKYTPCDAAQQRLVYLSCGEKKIVNDADLDSKAMQGMQAFGAKNYQTAVQYLDESWKTQRKNPEVLIALENARIELRKQKAKERNEPPPVVKTIAVVVPGTLEEYLPFGLLAAVAQAQSEWNNNRHEWLLQVVIGNDYNDPARAKAEVVREILKRPNILGVIGHYSSSITRGVLPAYHAAETTLISGTSTSTDLTGSPFFFRTPSSNKTQVSNIVKYLKSKQIKRIYLLHGIQTFAMTFKDELVRQAEENQIGVQFSGLSSSDLNPKRSFDKMRLYDSQLLVLAPDGFVNKKDRENVHQIILNNAGKLPIIGNELINEPWLTEQVEQQPELGNNLIFSLTWHKNVDPHNFSLSSYNHAPEWWQDRNNEISPRTVLTYDATRVLIDAINIAKEKQIIDDDLKIKKEVSEIISVTSFTGMSGKITFNGTDRKENLTGLVRARFDENGKFQGYKKPD